MVDTLRALEEIPVFGGGDMDLDGETVSGGRLIGARGLRFSNFSSTGPIELRDCSNVSLSHARVELGEQYLMGGVRILGGRDLILDTVDIHGGLCAGQFGIGLSNGKAPVSWTLTGCTASGNGPWGVYPQPHALYVLTTPDYSTNGMIVGCRFSQPGLGATVKVGGTGDNPLVDGANGVTFLDTVILGEVDPTGTSGVVALEGYRTVNIGFERCTFAAEDGAPRITAKSGARAWFQECKWDDHGVQRVEWYRSKLFGYPILKTDQMRPMGQSLGTLTWR